VKKELSKKIDFPCGIQMPNPFMLAPMTNTQSHDDGRLSEEEFRWLTMRAEGGFGLTMTCASYVQKDGKGFPGQLGIYSDDVQAGHQRLAKSIKAAGSLAVIQLFHAGMRSPKELIGRNPMTATDQEKADVRELLHKGVDFVALGKAAILHFDFPIQAAHNPDFQCIGLPVSREYLKKQGLSAPFIKYMQRWDGFVSE
jgi:2,4-dienoyl-CoA reductase-like NADH-dependent reductase (Old Yellow Enzyme family)